MSISKKVLEHPVLTLCVFALIAIIAIFTLGKIKIALLPEVTFPQVAVQTVYENAGPESVEKSVTEVLESGLMSVNKLKKLTSKSYEGFSSITLELPKIDVVGSHAASMTRSPSSNWRMNSSRTSTTAAARRD